VWATLILRTIIDAKDKKPQALSLRDQLINMPPPTQKYYFDDANKKAVTKCLTEGVYLN
jgi:hypothetical protein